MSNALIVLLVPLVVNAPAISLVISDLDWFCTSTSLEQCYLPLIYENALMFLIMESAIQIWLRCSPQETNIAFIKLACKFLLLVYYNRIDNDTALDLLGIEIGDYLAMVAVIASALIFYFGYSRTRKSEQIKIARALMDRIESKKQVLDGFAYSLVTAVSADVNPADVPSPVKSDDVISRAQTSIIEILEEIDYFSYLVKSHEIEDKAILKYYFPKVENVLKDFFKILDTYDDLMIGNVRVSDMAKEMDKIKMAQEMDTIRYYKSLVKRIRDRTKTSIDSWNSLKP